MHVCNMVRHSGAVQDRTRNLEVWGTTFMAYYVYILASRKDGVIYIGVTNYIVRRVYEHRMKAVPGFTSKYNITRLVWFEVYDDPTNAITREKELKKWKRRWKTELIEAQNPQWNDLYESICK